ncbi:hypothetical protein J6590_048279 [Homalodisca vitripennis]|nr:hypothetical protein J6590_048279 [Homalodisca vitripennis]
MSSSSTKVGRLNFALVLRRLCWGCYHRGPISTVTSPDDDMEDQQQTHVSSSIVSSSRMAPPSIEPLEECPPLLTQDLL